MKQVIFSVLSLFNIYVLMAQGLIGAWEMSHVSENGDNLKSVVIFSEGHQTISVFNETTGKFISTNGGMWRLDQDTMTEKIEFDSDRPERVGSEISFQIDVSENHLQIVGTDMKFTKIDGGTPGALQGAWLMSGRVLNEEMQTRDTDRPRKTMKILSGTRFQWIAYNTETKEFLGTGGGSYTTTNGAYVETIEFFSKDPTRVGARLPFEYELINGQWHHKGLSSKGKPIHEVWTNRLLFD